MISRVNGMYDALKLSYDLRDNILANRDYLLPYEPVIATDTGELYWKDEQGNLRSGINQEAPINIEQLIALNLEANTILPVFKAEISQAEYVSGELTKSLNNASITVNRLDTAIVDGTNKVAELKTTGTEQLNKIVATGTSQNEKVTITGNAKIEEIKTTQGMKGDRGDVNFATFEIVGTELIATITLDSGGLQFSLNKNGELEVEING